MIDQIANEIMLASMLLKTNRMGGEGGIAENLGYQPILLMNALFAGERDGKFIYVKKKDIIKISEDVALEGLLITKGLRDSRDQIETFISNMNAAETDLTEEELHTFIPNLPMFMQKLAISTSEDLATYEITDPKDKDSTYTFITLKDNIDKRWGEKQFDVTKENKFAKAGKKGKK